MRKLIDGTNVDGVSADYPKGRVRDESLPTLGTILNEIIVGDITQFFQRLINIAGVTENDLPDNVTNGYQLFEALTAFIQSKINTNQDTTRVKVFDIGDWDMDATANISVDITASGDSGDVEDDFNSIVDFSAIIVSDPNFIANKTLKTELLDSGSRDLEYDSVASTEKVLLARTTSGKYDSINYNQTSYNRGWVIVRYKI